jgi:hypothetical protein
MPSRTYELFAQVQVIGSLGSDMSARLNLYVNSSQGTLAATSGRVNLDFVNNGTTLRAIHPHYRTGPTQTTIPALNGTLIMYGPSGHFNIVGEFDLVIRDVGTVAPS